MADPGSAEDSDALLSEETKAALARFTSLSLSSDDDDEPSLEELFEGIPDTDRAVAQVPTPLDKYPKPGTIAFIGLKRCGANVGAVLLDPFDFPTSILDPKETIITVGKNVTIHYFASVSEYEKSGVRANKIVFLAGAVYGPDGRTRDALIKEADRTGRGATLIVCGEEVEDPNWCAGFREQFSLFEGVEGRNITLLFASWFTEDTTNEGRMVERLGRIDWLRREVANHLVMELGGAGAGAGAGAAGAAGADN